MPVGKGRGEGELTPWGLARPSPLPPFPRLLKATLVRFFSPSASFFASAIVVGTKQRRRKRGIFHSDTAFLPRINTRWQVEQGPDVKDRGLPPPPLSCQL